MTEVRQTIWLCGACGRSNDDPWEIGDESCFMNAVKVYTDSIVRDTNGSTTVDVLPDQETEWTKWRWLRNMAGNN